MLELLQAILPGVVQGLTEFLPVSSSGHLLLGQYFLGRCYVRRTPCPTLSRARVPGIESCDIGPQFDPRCADKLFRVLQRLQSEEDRQTMEQIGVFWSTIDQPLGSGRCLR